MSTLRNARLASHDRCIDRPGAGSRRGALLVDGMIPGLGGRAELRHCPADLAPVDAEQDLGGALVRRLA